ncbi:AMP-binding protein [Blastochloris sulfoviridis]|uniref:AMP-binding protein n=1 Tax=Blastochloris sulfoviridis TaxID=50712 RepID=A0A5M6I594_9HYPH|nr:AMP-binding protein [Blastochloris sulfoviridis]KAA5603401.1 AMP-binding protein [Blastochloris sulfoviridis]
MGLLPDRRDYRSLYDEFRWRIPDRYNIAVDACERWAAADPDRLALIFKHADGRVEQVTYGRLSETSSRLANALAAHGIGRGDRVAILLPQAVETVVTHLALYKLATIAVPLAALFGPDAIAYRLATAGAKALVTDTAGLGKLAAVSDDLPDLKLVISIDGDEKPAKSFSALVEAGAPHFLPEHTSPDDPAMMIFTSGTTGNPKGALHGHRVLLGHMPGVQMFHEFTPQPGDRYWTPADWAWAGGLLNVLLPGLKLGVPVVGRRAERFDPEDAFRLMGELDVANAFVPPTALRMLRAVPSPKGRHRLRLRTLGSGGEALGAETLDWGRTALGLTINEFYGQTECNLVLSSCAAIGVSRPGAIGLPVPGHEVAVIRPDGTTCDIGETGQIAVRRPDPVMFLEYWNQPDATAEKFIDNWMTTGDQGSRDEDGYVHFVGRDDDVITSSGYRIGPGEIEDCLLKHPAVALAAVVGKPDPLRTEIVKAFVVLKENVAASDKLAGDIQMFVKQRLSAHEYPREVAFIDEMPMTTTGKIIRRALRALG